MFSYEITTDKMPVKLIARNGDIHRTTNLTQTEAVILRTLFARPNEIVSREDLLTIIGSKHKARTIDKFISAVRVRMGTQHFPIITISGQGYCFKTNAVKHTHPTTTTSALPVSAQR